MDSKDLLRAHGLGVLDREVTQGSDALHSNRLFGSSAVLAESGERGETRTEQRGSYNSDSRREQGKGVSATLALLA